MNGTQILFAIITGVIALYGAVLSTINLIRENKKNQRKLTINLSIGFLTYVHGLSDDQLIITIANTGFKNLTINTPELSLPDGNKFIFPNPNSNVHFPHELLEGKNAVVWLDYKVFINELKHRGFKDQIKLQPSISDQSGKRHFGKKQTFKIPD